MTTNKPENSEIEDESGKTMINDKIDNEGAELVTNFAKRMLSIGKGDLRYALYKVLQQYGFDYGTNASPWGKRTEYGESFNTDQFTKDYATAIITLIEEVFQECVPEKQYTTVGLVVDPHDLSKGGTGKVLIENGYNQAIRDFEANFKKVMGK